MPKKKVDTKNTPAPVPVTPPPVMVKTAADKIWDEIKNLNIEMFGLADQRVHMYCKPVPADPTKLFLVASAGAVLPALELVVAPRYAVEQVDRFIVVTPAVNPLFK